MPILKSKKQTFMIFMERCFGNMRYSLKPIFTSVLIIGFSLQSFSQMTTRQMDNFKKISKEKKKKQKQKGPSINTKKRSSSPKKTRQKKSGFTKRRYKLSYILLEEYFMNIS